jgi:hypothetical protein
MAMTSKAQVEAGTSNTNHVYITSDQYSWMPARVVEYSTTDPNQVIVSLSSFKDEDSIGSSKGQKSSQTKTTTTITIDLTTYPNRSLPLQNVDQDGILQQVEDMVDLPFLHEVSRTKYLYQCIVYTREQSAIRVSLS